MHAWEIYLAELRQRAPGAESWRGVGRDRIGEAAHEAYRAASDRLTGRHHWDDEHTLVVMRGLNAAVREWLDSDGDWTALERELERREREVTDGFGSPASRKPPFCHSDLEKSAGS